MLDVVAPTGCHPERQIAGATPAGEDGGSGPVYEGRRQVPLPAATGLFRVRLAKNIVEFTRVSVVSGQLLRSHGIAVPAVLLLIRFKDFLVVHSGAYQVDREPKRSFVGTFPALWSPVFVLGEVLFQTGHDADALLPDIFGMLTGRIVVGAFGPQGEVLGLLLLPFQIGKVLMLPEGSQRSEGQRNNGEHDFHAATLGRIQSGSNAQADNIPFLLPWTRRSDPAE